MAFKEIWKLTVFNQLIFLTNELSSAINNSKKDTSELVNLYKKQQQSTYCS